MGNEIEEMTGVEVLLVCADAFLESPQRAILRTSRRGI